MADPKDDARRRQAMMSRALKALRRRRNVSAAQLATAIGMKLRSYEHFESGRSRVNVDRLRLIAEAMEVDAVAILAAVDLGSPEFAVRCADNKFMEVFMMALAEFDEASGEQISRLDPQSLMAAFRKLFQDLAKQARDRWSPEGPATD